MSENLVLQNEENVIIATFNITEAGTTITLKEENLIGMNGVDWGDPNDNSIKLTHTYSIVGEYTCKIYNVTIIDDYAFFDYSSLTSIVIPDGVTSIGYYAFYNCSNLTSAVFKSLNPLDDLILWNSHINDSKPTYYVPQEAVEAYQTAWAKVVNSNKIFPDSTRTNLINLDGLRIYHNALKEKYLDKKLDKTGGLISGDLSVGGNLNVAGTTTTKDTETVLIKDNIIVANSDGNELLEEAGFAVKTGADAAYGIMYDPDGDGVKIGLGAFDENGKFQYGIKEDGVSEAQFLATRADAIPDGNLVKWDDTEKKMVDAGNNYIKNTDYATSSKPGVVTTHSDFGISSVYVNNTGMLSTMPASKAEIDKKKEYHYKPITPGNLEYATMSALADCQDKTIWTDDTTDENENVVKGTKSKACETIGVTGNFVAKDKTRHTWLAGQTTLYATQYDGNGMPTQSTAYVTGSPVSGRIPRWSGRSTLLTEAPTQAKDCTNKEYVDTLIAGLQAQIDELKEEIKTLKGE